MERSYYPMLLSPFCSNRTSGETERGIVGGQVLLGCIANDLPSRCITMSPGDSHVVHEATTLISCPGNIDSAIFSRRLPGTLLLRFLFYFKVCTLMRTGPAIAWSCLPQTASSNDFLPPSSFFPTNRPQLFFPVFLLLEQKRCRLRFARPFIFCV